MNTIESNQHVVSIQSLTRRFENAPALQNVSIQVRKGQVFGIVGENGAGKTTLIKHILGLYRAQQGEVRVFGLDPVASPDLTLARIGYLSEEPDMPGWMKVSEILNYSSAFYSDWDHDYANELLDMFDVNRSKKVKQLSKGQKARLGLCLAQAHRPDLLLLDEPSSGLDPNVRNDILRAVIQTVVDEGGTVIFSSHLLEEVERVSDHLMMLSHGRALLSEPMDDVLARHHRLILGRGGADCAVIEGVIQHRIKGQESVLDCYGDLDQITNELTHRGADILAHSPMTLNEIFVARSTGNATMAGQA